MNDRPSTFQTDSITASVLLLAALTVVQRGMGLLRNIWFCRLLADDQLGRWSLIYNFLLLAAPLVVLGLPGSFGRYAERYRQRGQFKAFLLRTTALSGLATLVAFFVVRAWPDGVMQLLFGSVQPFETVVMLASVLAMVIVFNFLVELLTALRLVRFASLMQLASSMVFVICGLILLVFTPLGEHAVLMAYGGGAATASVLGVVVTVCFWRSLPRSEPPLAHRDLWSVLLPFAGWIWTANLISNLFTVTDQFMLKHFSGLPSSAADALVGQYYASRLVPLLLISVAALLSGMLLPHLSSDWESGHRERARWRLNRFVKLLALSFTGAAALVLMCAPLLFQGALGGRYNHGLAVLPGTLTYCIWFSMATVAANYLWCVEKARLASAALLGGLAVNIVLNYVFAPRFGLAGVVSATIIANAVALASVFLLTALSGMRWQRTTWLMAMLPLALWMGGATALGIVVVVAAIGWWKGWMVTNGEFGRLADSVAAARWCFFRRPGARVAASRPGDMPTW